MTSHKDCLPLHLYITSEPSFRGSRWDHLAMTCGIRTSSLHHSPVTAVSWGRDAGAAHALAHVARVPRVRPLVLPRVQTRVRHDTSRHITILTAPSANTRESASFVVVRADADPRGAEAPRHVTPHHPIAPRGARFDSARFEPRDDAVPSFVPGARSAPCGTVPCPAQEQIPRDRVAPRVTVRRFLRPRQVHGPHGQLVHARTRARVDLLLVRAISRPTGVRRGARMSSDGWYHNRR